MVSLSISVDNVDSYVYMLSLTFYSVYIVYRGI
jgi:hypothetical protein